MTKLTFVQSQEDVRDSGFAGTVDDPPTTQSTLRNRFTFCMALLVPGWMKAVQVVPAPRQPRLFTVRMYGLSCPESSR